MTSRLQTAQAPQEETLAVVIPHSPFSPGQGRVCRRAVPLAVALLSISNPTMTTMDTLSRLSHDSDQEVAQNAVIALGETSSYRQTIFA